MIRERLDLVLDCESTTPTPAAGGAILRVHGG